jgi:hypothetical protein
VNIDRDNENHRNIAIPVLNLARISLFVIFSLFLGEVTSQLVISSGLRLTDTPYPFQSLPLPTNSQTLREEPLILFHKVLFYGMATLIRN